ncbi:spoIIIJ-associated protein [Micromonospora sp. A202]|uniref:Jag family protein n=1 Tax=Micromonospora sp. A202 TaxID=2572899 RepID=UPI00114FE5FD|nr:R3H domain-containing nucleic acid-binding protein [Micromonospora sp. A202]TQJ25882.1 spoIIIJ-associated protein [Micromonospora sp. A202]
MTETSIPRAEQSLDEEETATLAVNGDDTEDDETEDDETEDDETEADDDAEADDDTDTAAAGGRTKKAVGEGDLFRQSEIAADYVEGLLDILDYDGDIDELVAAGRPMVEVVGERLQNLVGQRGATLEALQELTRLAVFRQTGTPSRLLLDVGGYRANRRKELAAVAKNAVEKVKEHGEPVRLDAMSAFERKCVHDVVNAMSGVASESEGVEPNRRIVVRPAD